MSDGAHYRSGGPRLTAGFDEALLHAVELHRSDLRKQTTTPYVAHLLGVCSIALENGADEDEAITALLHDAAGDHGGRAQLEIIRGKFGNDVARIVEDCSDSLLEEGAPKGPWLERKQRYVAHLADIVATHPGSALVSAADKLYNLRSIHADLLRPGVGEGVFDRFSGNKWGTLWYYRALADVFSEQAGRHTEAAGELVRLIDDLSGGRSAATLLEKHLAEESTAPPAASQERTA